MTNSSLVISNISVHQDSDGRYCLNDLHKASGNYENHRPSKFLRTAQTKELIAEIEQSPYMGFALKTRAGGTGGSKTYACKELIYSYAMWISASFSLKVIRAYDKLVSPQKPYGLKEILENKDEVLSSEASKLKQRFLIVIQNGVTIIDQIPEDFMVITKDQLPTCIDWYMPDYKLVKREKTEVLEKGLKDMLKQENTDFFNPTGE